MGCSKKTTIFVIGGILVVIALAVGLGVGLSGGSKDDDTTDVKPKVSISDYLSGKYTGKSFNFNFVSSEVQNSEGTLVYSSNEDGDINIDQFSPEENDFVFSKSLAKNTKFDEETWFTYRVSPDQKFILFGYDRKKLWRSVSYNATYQLYDVESQKYIDSAWSKTPPSACDSNNSDNPEIQYISWAPKGHSLVMVCHYNIWYTSDPTDEMVQVQDTLDGLENQIYNGIPEWAYEEEMLGSNNAIYWSPEGTRFLWVKFVTQTYFDAQKGSINDHLYRYSWYGDGTNQYPETKAISFAKAGTTPSSNELFVFDTATSKSTSLKSMQPFETNIELPYGLWSRCDWLDENNFVGIWQNRIQSSSESVFFKFDNNWSRQDSGSVTEFTEKTGWVGSFGPWWPFYDLEDSYFTIRTKKVDESFAKLGARADAEIKEGFWTVARVDRMSNEITYLSEHQAAYTDTDLIHYDSKNDILWFYAAAPLPRHRQIHFVRDASKAENVAPECATCGLYNEYPNACGQALISTVGNNQDSSHVFIKCAGGVDVPMYFYKSYKDFMDPESAWALMEDNAKLKSDIEQVSMPVKEYGTMESENWPDKEYHFQLFKPDNFDENKKYPLLIEVYAGPEFQKVEDRWSVDFCRSMASEYDLVCASVDGRGSAFEGDRFMQQVYMKLGQTECVDQTEFGKFMGQKSWIDASKIAIWGWSYGGYTTTKTLGYGNNGKNDIFKCGVAVAPLASWRYYNNIYSERYMNLPFVEENQPLQESNPELFNDEGYTQAEMWYHGFEGYRNNWYTLIHGTADDNVHFMSAAHMEMKLVAEDIDFDTFYYADEDHSINSTPEVKEHVYNTIARHLTDHHCLDLEKLG